MNHLDLPPPDLPPSQRPMTWPEMHVSVAERLESIGASPGMAHERAWRALTALLDGGYLEPWGMNELGEMLYSPTTPKPRSVVVIVKKKN